MKISLLTMWLNEEFFAPHFLRHYGWVDEINVFIDEATVDSTEEIARADGRVKIQKVAFPAGFDNQRRADIFNDFANDCDADWLIVVDSDELIFHPCYNDVRKCLQSEESDVVFARMWQIYQHVSEGPLRADAAPLFQRRHGDPNRSHGKNALYIKPSVFRPRKSIELSVGSHYFRAPVGTRVARWQLYGSHWAFADVGQAVHRQIENGKKRLGKADLERGLASHLWHVNEQTIRATAKHFENSPLVLRGRWWMKFAHVSNALVNTVFRGSAGYWLVEDAEKWNDGRQFDVVDNVLDRRMLAAKLREKAAMLFGRRPRL